MAKAASKLRARSVATLSEPGRHSDGGGLYLQVSSSGAKSWLFLFERDGRRRGRIEKVLDAAKAKGLRHSENPARWRGYLALLLPKRNKLQRGHHPATAYKDLPAFLARLRPRDSVSAFALELPS